MKHRGHSGTTSVLKSMWKEQYKKEYKRKDYDKDKLSNIRSKLKELNPSDKANKVENNLRIQVIKELLS